MALQEPAWRWRLDSIDFSFHSAGISLAPVGKSHPSPVACLPGAVWHSVILRVLPACRTLCLEWGPGMCWKKLGLWVLYFLALGPWQITWPLWYSCPHLWKKTNSPCFPGSLSRLSESLSLTPSALVLDSCVSAVEIQNTFIRCSVPYTLQALEILSS
jgi:hypothetical protein